MPIVNWLFLFMASYLAAVYAMCIHYCHSGWLVVGFCDMCMQLQQKKKKKKKKLVANATNATPLDPSLLRKKVLAMISTISRVKSLSETATRGGGGGGRGQK